MGSTRSVAWTSLARLNFLKQGLQMKNRFLIGLLTLIVLALCTACGHKHNSSSTSTSSIRLVNATKVAGLSLTVTNSTANSTAQTVATGRDPLH